ncbi:MAG TPA: outer membrane beta-barrel protein [Terriglobales bacterium]|nr:outer membrane beta-barrel protein [Terriglobales bacterium]
MKKLVLIAAACLFFFSNQSAHAQIEAAFGMGTLTAPSASSASGDYSPVTLSGGLYPSFNANFFVRRHLGFGGEIAWRAKQNLYQGYQPYRPLFSDFNAVYAPHLSDKITPEFSAGMGVESLHFYGYQSCGFSGCTNYVSSNHFMGHFSAALKYNIWGHVFVRPEAHLYAVHNNVEFSSPWATRFGVSIGYSFTPY